MIIKIWPDGSTAIEEVGYNGPELTHGHSDDFFIINTEVHSLEVAKQIIKKQLGDGHLGYDTWMKVLEEFHNAD